MASVVANLHEKIIRIFAGDSVDKYNLYYVYMGADFPVLPVGAEVDFGLESGVVFKIVGHGCFFHSDEPPVVVEMYMDLEAIDEEQVRQIEETAITIEHISPATPPRHVLDSDTLLDLEIQRHAHENAVFFSRRSGDES